MLWFISKSESEEKRKKEEEKKKAQEVDIMFPNKKRNTILSVLFATVAMVSFALFHGIASIQLLDRNSQYDNEDEGDMVDDDDDDGGDEGWKG